MSKIISANMLNRLWKNGIKPTVDTVANKIKSYSNLMSNEDEGKLADAVAIKEGFTDVNNQLADLNADIITNLGTTSKKNLLPITAKSQSINGVTFTVNNDGSVTATGTATANATFPYNPSVYIGSGKKIKLNGCPSGGGIDKYVLRLVEQNSTIPVTQETGNGVTYTADKDYYGVRLIIYSGQTMTGQTFYPMIRDASIEDSTYEPYVPSNLEIKKELTKIDSNFGTTGKNLLPPYYWNSTYGTTHVTNGITLTFRSDGSITANGTATADVNLVLKASAKASDMCKYNGYILSGSTGGSKDTYFIGLIMDTSPWTLYGSSIDGDGVIGVNAKIPNDDNINCKILLKILSGVTMTGQTFYPMIREASIADPTYEPYAPSNLEIKNRIVNDLVSVSASTNKLDIAGASALKEVADRNCYSGFITSGYASKLFTNLGLTENTTLTEFIQLFPYASIISFGVNNISNITVQYQLHKDILTLTPEAEKGAISAGYFEIKILENTHKRAMMHHYTMGGDIHIFKYIDDTWSYIKTI